MGGTPQKKKKTKRNGSIGNSHEPSREKTNNLGFRPGLTQTGLHIHRGWLEAGTFGFTKMRNFTICVAETKALISCAVTALFVETLI